MAFAGTFATEAPFLSKSSVSGPGRDSEPVVVGGSALHEFAGHPIDELKLFRFDASIPGYVPVPYQIDERLTRVFNQGTELEFEQVIYDYEGADDRLLDGQDELVFMFRDASMRAPSEVAWPDGSSTVRYEIEIEDPRPGSSVPSRWVYLFSGAGLPVSPATYVTYSGTPGGRVTTENYEAGYSGNWLLTELKVRAPCGDGSDMIDRWKGRAQPLQGNREDEEGWSSNSEFLGALTGPVRAIRGVRGAMSAVNTIHQDVMSEWVWERRIKLRVHPLPRAWFYFDWLPRSGTTLFTSSDTQGLVVDGSPEAPSSTAAVDWSVISGNGGGLAVVYDVPDSPLYQAKSLYYRDDAGYNDQISTNPFYSDEDDSSIGAHGLEITNVAESNLEAVDMRLRGYLLCSGEGGQQVGEQIKEFDEFPLVPSAHPQWIQLAPIRDLEIATSGDDIVLSWQPRAEMVSYRVFTSPTGDLPQGSWDLAGSPSEPTFVDAGQAVSMTARFYSVVGVNDQGEIGPW